MNAVVVRRLLLQRRLHLLNADIQVRYIALVCFVLIFQILLLFLKIHNQLCCTLALIRNGGLFALKRRQCLRLEQDLRFLLGQLGLQFFDSCLSAVELAAELTF